MDRLTSASTSPLHLLATITSNVGVGICAWWHFLALSSIGALAGILYFGHVLVLTGILCFYIDRVNLSSSLKLDRADSWAIIFNYLGASIVVLSTVSPGILSDSRFFSFFLDLLAILLCIFALLSISMFYVQHYSIPLWSTPASILSYLSFAVCSGAIINAYEYVVLLIVICGIFQAKQLYDQSKENTVKENYVNKGAFFKAARQLRIPLSITIIALCSVVPIVLIIIPPEQNLVYLAFASYLAGLAFDRLIFLSLAYEVCYLDFDW